MKKLIILLFAISLAAFGQQPPESLEGKIILMLKNNTSLSDGVKADVQYKTGNFKIDEINRLHQFTSVTKQRLGQKTNKFIHIIQFPPGTNLKPIIDAYYETGEIEYAEPDYVGVLGGTQEVIPDDQYYFRQWGLHNDGTFPPGVAVAGCDLDMQNAWEIEQGDTSIIVGIIDSGVKFDHPELAGRAWINYDEIPGNLIDDDENGYIDDVQGWNFAGSNNNPVDGHGHGTNIAGIIGANSNNTIGYSGVDWNCKLMILKGFTDGGSGNVSWWANAVYYAVDNGARVINMSFGTTNNSITFQDAVNYAMENNVVLVACMMNSNSNTAYYPAAYPGVIAVGSTDWDDTRSQPFYNGLPGSNYGSHISVVAPGNVIFGLDYLSNTNYEIHFSGTSQATAYISGVAALLLAQDPERTPADIKFIIEATAEDMVGDPLEDTPGWDQYYGFGRVNAYYALLSPQPCLPEGITFSTQEQIDNFQANYPGCTEIEGDVSIEGWNITNLNGLSVLISIGGYLEIYYNNDLTSLTGLENLTSIGGSLDIIDNYALSSVTGLMSLTYLGGDLNTIRDHSLTSLTGLENLTSIGGDVSIEVNLSLTSLTGLDNLTSIGGKLQIGDYDYGNPALTSLSGLDNLISIGGNMFIGYNPELTDMTALDNVTSFQGDVTITGNYSLTNCAIQNICNYLNSPNGVVGIYNNGPGCNSQSEVVSACGGSIPCLPYGNYFLLSQDDVDNFQINFPACNDLAGNLIITGNSIVNLAGLNQVNSIEGSACIDYCDNLENLNGLENLYSIGGSLGVHENNQLLSLSGLESLDFIDGLLAIGTIDDGGAPSAPPGGNPLLTSISSLSSLTDVGGLDIGQNPSLLSLSGLDNIDANTLAYVAIGLNSSLSTCEVQSICDYLAAPNAYILIFDNAPGCNSPEEVIEACLIPVEEVAGETGIRIIPNPARDMITVSLPMLTGNAQLTLFNITGEKLLEKQITRAETQLDISALPRGVYFVRVQGEKMVEVAKIIKE